MDVRNRQQNLGFGHVVPFPGARRDINARTVQSVYRKINIDNGHATTFVPPSLIPKDIVEITHPIDGRKVPTRDGVTLFGTEEHAPTVNALDETIQKHLSNIDVFKKVTGKCPNGQKHEHGQGIIAGLIRTLISNS